MFQYRRSIYALFSKLVVSFGGFAPMPRRASATKHRWGTSVPSDPLICPPLGKNPAGGRARAGSGIAVLHPTFSSACPLLLKLTIVQRRLITVTKFTGPEMSGVLILKLFNEKNHVFFRPVSVRSRQQLNRLSERKQQRNNIFRVC